MKNCNNPIIVKIVCLAIAVLLVVIGVVEILHSTVFVVAVDGEDGTPPSDGGGETGGGSGDTGNGDGSGGGDSGSGGTDDGTGDSGGTGGTGGTPASTPTPPEDGGTHPTPTPTVTPTPTPSASPNPSASPSPSPSPTESEEPSPSPSPSQPGLRESSISRYSKYLKFRTEIYAQLKPKMESITFEFQERLDLIASMFDAKEYELLRMIPDYADDVDIFDGEVAYKAEHQDQLSISNWGDVLAVFVALHCEPVNKPLDLVNLRKISWDELHLVFNDMNKVTYTFENGKLRLILKSFTYSEMADLYNLDEIQRNYLDELMQPEFQSVFAAFTGNETFNKMSDDRIGELKNNLPSNLSAKREDVVLTAYSLVGKVNYFWGGKHEAIGWNVEWGIPLYVTSLGSKSRGSLKPFGLDCSGYVNWVFINAYNDTAISPIIAQGTAHQWANSASLGWDEAQPGDLAFFRAPGNGGNHVGIVVSKEPDGTYMVAHCSSDQNNIIVSEAWSSGFRYMRRPVVFE